MSKKPEAGSNRRCQRISAEARDALRAVTDHAVLRYLQRHHNIDMDAIRAQLLAHGRAALIRQMPSGWIKAHDLGVVLVCQGGSVVTILATPKAERRPA